MLKSLNNIIDDVKRKPYDLLDYTKNAFDRDFLEFNVNINDLELQLQVGVHVWHKTACIRLRGPQQPGALGSIKHARAHGVGWHCGAWHVGVLTAHSLRLNVHAWLALPGAQSTCRRAS